MKLNSELERQAGWHQQLLSASHECPAGLTTWNGSDPNTRFNVYRNNVMVSLIDALADGYPVVQHLVGEEFFRAMSREFIRLHPPSSPVLAWYGAEYPNFIATFPPAASVAYLADMACLERLRVEAWHEADAQPISPQILMALLSDEGLLAKVGFALHPAVRTFKSCYPVVSIWGAHQADSVDLTHIDFSQQEAALLVRPELGVEIIPVDGDVVDFIEALSDGTPLAQAAALFDNFDLASVLALLINKQAIVGTIEEKGQTQC